MHRKSNTAQVFPEYSVLKEIWSHYLPGSKALLWFSNCHIYHGMLIKQFPGACSQCDPTSWSYTWNHIYSKVRVMVAVNFWVCLELLILGTGIKHNSNLAMLFWFLVITHQINMCRQTENSVCILKQLYFLLLNTIMSNHFTFNFHFVST